MSCFLYSSTYFEPNLKINRPTEIQKKAIQDRKKTITMVNDSTITIRKRVNSQINNPINKELPKIEIVEIIIKKIENNTGKNENIIKIVINSPKNGCSLVKF